MKLIRIIVKGCDQYYNVDNLIYMYEFPGESAKTFTVIVRFIGTDDITLKGQEAIDFAHSVQRIEDRQP